MLASGVSDIIETESNMSDKKKRKFRIISKGVNREYKDRLFKFIFGNPDNTDELIISCTGITPELLEEIRKDQHI